MAERGVDGRTRAATHTRQILRAFRSSLQAHHPLPSLGAPAPCCMTSSGLLFLFFFLRLRPTTHHTTPHITLAARTPALGAVVIFSVRRFPFGVRGEAHKNFSSITFLPLWLAGHFSGAFFAPSLHVPLVNSLRWCFSRT